VAADAQGRVYVSGTAIVLVPDQDNSRILTRTFQSIVRRYVRGQRYPGIPDIYMPGCGWYRDTLWTIEQGQGFGNVVDPRGIYWSPYNGGALYAAVAGRNYAQRFSDAVSSSGESPSMGSADDLPLENPVDVYTDLAGYVYVVDQGNQRVLRFAPDKSYVQRVDFETDQQQQHVLTPTAVAADDSLAYVADPGRSEVLRLKRRK
jgi:DNA-binding beta-propeller fold protein YncE